MTQPLQALRVAGLLSPLDVHLARALGRLAGESDPDVLLAAALVSRQTAQGDVCLDLKAVGGAPLQRPEGGPTAWLCPEAGPWIEKLARSPLVSGSGGFTPLVLDAGGRLYLGRYYRYQQRLAAAIRERARAETAGIDEARLADGLRRLFPDPHVSLGREAESGVGRQRLAALTAVLRRLAVISGGPGTGKTSTAVRILALLIEQARASGGKLPRILMLAPTGKAAARLIQAVRQAKSGACAPPLDCPPETLRAIPEQAATIHRALAPLPDNPTRFRHH
ncbi:MAG: AAA family ATPase, partial [Acidobacteriota bacterium]